MKQARVPRFRQKKLVLSGVAEKEKDLNIQISRLVL